MKKSTACFLVFAIIWEIAVGLLYGFFLRYSTNSFKSMASPQVLYPLPINPTTSVNVQVNSTQFPFPQAVVVIAIFLLIVGFAMIAGYIQRTTVTGMAFTLLIFAFTAQNFHIYREFWNRASVNDPNSSSNFSGQYYEKINYINFGNSHQYPYAYTSSSFIDAIGASLAMYAGYTAVIGRIGLGEIFFLTWIGTFFYELNSQLLWRFQFPDNGFASRAWGFGGMMGLVSSLVLGKKDITGNNPYFSSRYRVMGLALLGIIFVWCSFPIVVLTSVYESTAGMIIAMTGQVNIWLALAASVLGVYSATSLFYRKFSVHQLVFTSITGAIAFSSSTDINYNSGFATAVGFGVGFICCLLQISLKRKFNAQGVIDSNSVIFHFIIPSLFAAIFSAIAQGIGNTSISYTDVSGKVVNYSNLVQSSRSYTQQGGYQIVGWLLSIGFGSVTGLIIGIIYRLINEHDEPKNAFNDAFLYDYPKTAKQNEQNKRQEVQMTYQDQKGQTNELVPNTTAEMAKTDNVQNHPSGPAHPIGEQGPFATGNVGNINNAP